MSRLDPQMEECARQCLDCARACYEAAMNEETGGGRRIRPALRRLLLNCAEICRTNASFLRNDSELHRLTCEVCAEICLRCADACEGKGNLEECSELSRRCAGMCARMAGNPCGAALAEA